MEGLWLVVFCFVYSFGHIPSELLNEVYISFPDLSTYSHREEQISLIYLWISPSMYCCGHISLELPNKVYISFWPSTERGKFDIKHEQGNSKWFKTFSEETEEKGNPDCYLEVRDLNTTAITEWWNAFSNQDPKYNVWSQNCATVVLDALSKGNPWFKDFGYVKTPKDVFEITQCYVNNQQVSKDSIYFKYILLCMFRYFLLIIYNSYTILLFGLISFACIVIYIFYNSRKDTDSGIKKTEEDPEKIPVLVKIWTYDEPSLDEQDDPEKMPVHGKTWTYDEPSLDEQDDPEKMPVHGRTWTNNEPYRDEQDASEKIPVHGKTLTYDEPSLDEEDASEKIPALGKTLTYDEPSPDEQDDPEKIHVPGKTWTSLDELDLPSEIESF